MKTEILFKAKPFDPSVGGFNFIFGHYVELHGMKEGKKTIGHYIIPENDISNMVEVIPETVCQFWTQIKGIRIFEGDKFKHNDHIFVICYTNRFGYRAVCLNENFGNILTDGNLMTNHNHRDAEWIKRVAKYLTPIGNIHD